MSKQTLYVVGECTSLHIDPEAAWKAWNQSDDVWTLDTYILENGTLVLRETIYATDDDKLDEFYKKVVLATRIAELQKKLENTQIELKKAQDELNKP